MSVLEAKVVVLGAQGVGKTSVIHRYVGQMFVRHVSPTIGASFFSCKVNINEHRIKLLIWDTAGQERFRAMAPMYYRNANAALLMFDITSVDSYQAMKSWVGELQRNVEEPVVLCVVGNKCDMKEARRVNYKEALQFASSIDAFYYETSALSSEGVEDVFIHIAMELIKQNEQNNNPDSTNPTNELKSIRDGKIIRVKAEPTKSSATDEENEEKSFLCC